MGSITMKSHLSLLLTLFCLICLPGVVSGANVIGNADAGKTKTATCVACHGPDGNSTVPNWPKIAGQHQLYLENELRDFRLGEKGPRYEATMYGMTVNLTDQDIAD